MKKKKQKGLLSKGTALIRMTAANKITKTKVCSMIHQDQVWGKKKFLTSVEKIEKKGIKDRDKDAKK